MIRYSPIFSGIFIIARTIHSASSFHYSYNAPTPKTSQRPFTETTLCHERRDESLFARRSFLSDLFACGTLLTSSTLISGPVLPAFGAEPKKSLDQCLYTILRAREATTQETRLITSGKFKDVQRANVKLAVKFILNNYRLSDNVIAASFYLDGQRQVDAGNAGLQAVQQMYTILEYFDAAEVQNIKVGQADMKGKEQLVLTGLDAVRQSIDKFLSYFPSETIEKANLLIAEENQLNEKEFDNNLGNIVNLSPPVVSS